LSYSPQGFDRSAIKPQRRQGFV